MWQKWMTFNRKYRLTTNLVVIGALIASTIYCRNIKHELSWIFIFLLVVVSAATVFEVRRNRKTHVGGKNGQSN